MASLKEQAERLKRINLKNKVEEVLFFSDEILIGYNLSQLSEGRSNVNTLIGRYSKYTERASKDPSVIEPVRQKQEGDPYNFERSGEFFKAFTVKQINGGVEITSNVSYLDSIKRLGSRNNAQNKLFGLNEENLNKFIKEHLLPRAQKLIKETQ